MELTLSRFLSFLEDTLSSSARLLFLNCDPRTELGTGNAYNYLTPLRRCFTFDLFILLVPPCVLTSLLRSALFFVLLMFNYLSSVFQVSRRIGFK